MGLRQKLNENPIVTTTLTVIIMLAALTYIVMRVLGHGGQTTKIPTTAYFSDDDGKTWFIDDAKNIPPYDHNGKTAYLAILYRCNNGKPFVERVEQFDDDAKQQIQTDIQAGRPALAAEYRHMTKGMKIKRPGDADWIQLKEGDKDAASKWGQIMRAQCPDGSFGARPVSVEEKAQP